MIFVTTKELRLHYGTILERVRRGERVAITYRGKPVACLVPFGEHQEGNASLRPFEVAWRDIEATLHATEPPYPDVETALRKSRWRD
ncbi:MAG: type II toxin-antitoxin system prevent-host-death family antitoxin [Bacillota bacterium]